MNGSSFQRPLSLAERQLLQQSLSSGEQILWYVRPLGCFSVAEWRSMLLVMSGFCAGGLLFLVLLLGGQEQDGLMVAGAVFVLVWLALGLVIPFLILLNRRRDVYAVTNRHAVVLKSRLPLPRGEAVLYSLAANMVVEVVERANGSGDIVLAYESTSPDALGKRPPKGFLRVPHLDAVLEALQQAAAAFPPRTDAEHSRYVSWSDPRNSLRPAEKGVKVLSVVMLLLGGAALYGGLTLGQEPLRYLLQAERAVGTVVRTEREDREDREDAGSSYRTYYHAVYDYTLNGQRYCQRVEGSEQFTERPPLGMQATLLYFADAPLEVRVLNLRQLIGLPLFLCVWGAFFLIGGALAWNTECRKARKYRELFGERA